MSSAGPLEGIRAKLIRGDWEERVKTREKSRLMRFPRMGCFSTDDRAGCQNERRIVLEYQLFHVFQL